MISDFDENNGKDAEFEAQIADAIAASLKDMEIVTASTASTRPRSLSQVDDVLTRVMTEKKDSDLSSSKFDVFGIQFEEDKTQGKTFVISSFKDYPEKIRQFVIEWLCDDATLDAAELQGIVNWNRECPKTLVLKTIGDGNCLCHACSLYTWGIHDRNHQLRKCIERTMKGARANELKIRYRAETGRMRRLLGICGPTSEEVDIDWSAELAVFDSDSQSIQYLGAIHIFVLANVLHRPIIVYGNSLAVNADIGGVYLPLLWKDAKHTSPNPIPLLYSSSHFTPLVAAEPGQREYKYPLAIRDVALPVRFLLDNESPEKTLNEWMRIRSAAASSDGFVLAASTVATDPNIDALQEKFINIVAELTK